jgi:hypothetical protein
LSTHQCVAYLNYIIFTSIIDKDINSSEVLQGLLNDFLAILGFGQISKDELGFNIWVFLSEISNNILDFLIRCKSIEDDIESSCSKGVSNAESNSTE